MARILAVDDSQTMRQLVSFALSEVGHEVHDAEGYDAAVALANLHHFDIVISDLNMPGKNGIELVKTLRTLPHTRFVPILMLTTESQTKLRDAAKLAGATGWLVKPFQPVQLVDVVSKVLRI